MSWNSGAAFAPPDGASSMIATANLGLSAGKTPANVALFSVVE